MDMGVSRACLVTNPEVNVYSLQWASTVQWYEKAELKICSDSLPISFATVP